MTAPFHLLNWYAGWIGILLAFVSGAAIGMFFHDRGWLGGYDSFRRQMVRLGHIALAALGTMNVVYSLSPWPTPGTREATIAGWGLLLGGALMPGVCWLSAWRERFRHLFPLPVICLIAGVWNVLCGGR
jgi:hypothetical protein